MKRDHFLVEAKDLLTKINHPNIQIFDATIMFYMGLSPEEVAKMPTAHEQYLAGHILGAAFFDTRYFLIPIALMNICWARMRSWLTRSVKLVSRMIQMSFYTPQISKTAQPGHGGYFGMRVWKMCVCSTVVSLPGKG
jgi:hypothetical protein